MALVRAGRLALGCAALLAVSATLAAAQPAGEPAPRVSTEPPGEPDVVVRGRGLGELRLRIRVAEEAIFARFNDINSTDDFDIHCRMETPIGSHIKERVCESNIARELNERFAQATLGGLRGESGVPASQFVGEQLVMQRRLGDEVRRLALEDEELRSAVLNAQLALAERTGKRVDFTASRQVAAGAEGLPFGAERLFEVRLGPQTFDHLLTRRTFTITNVTGTIRSLSLGCREGRQKLDYEPDVEWTVPANWSSCILRVRGRPDTTFALYEF